MKRRGAIAAVLAVSAVLAACGEEDKRYADARIVDKLNLEEIKGEQGFAIDGDPFCAVEPKLLNTRSEVEDAVDEDSGLVVTSAEANVGVVGIPVFANDCRQQARKKLNKLDPEPKD